MQYGHGFSDTLSSMGGATIYPHLLVTADALLVNVAHSVTDRPVQSVAATLVRFLLHLCLSNL